MAINIVQAAGGQRTFSSQVNGTYTFTVAFSSAVANGNSILVLMSEDNVSSFPGLAFNLPTDTSSNSYASIISNPQPRSSGPGSAAAWSLNVVGGSLTVTISVTFTDALNSNSMRISAYCLEISGMPAGSSVFSSDFDTIFGATGNTPVARNISDSVGNTVTITFGGSSGSGGPGTCALNAIDFQAGGTNFFLLFIVNQSGSSVPTANHGYTFTLYASSAPGATFNVFTPGLPVATIQQPQIFAVT